MRIIKPVSTKPAGFARNSIASYFDSTGLLRYAPVNTARLGYSYDATTGKWLSNNFALEAGTTNFALNSEDFTSASYSKQGGATVTADTNIAPDGNKTADTLQFVDSNSNLQCALSAIISPFSCVSVFAKKGTRDKIRLLNSGQGYEFDLSSGTFSSTSAGAGSSIASMQNVGNGWYRCCVTNAGNSSVGFIYPGSDLVSGSNVLIWGFQYEPCTASDYSAGRASSYMPTTSAAAVRPTETLAGSGFVASSVPENDAPFWVQPSSSDAGYAKSAKVIAGHHIFQSLIAANKNNPLNDILPASWLDLGADNQQAMFDKGAAQLIGDTQYQRSVYRIGTSTVNNGVIDVVIRPGQVVNAVALFGLKGQSVQVQLVDPVDGIVYDKTIKLIDPSAYGMWEWLFKPIIKKTTMTLLDLPGYGTADLRIRIFPDANNVAACSMLTTGTLQVLGTTCFGSSVGITDYSSKQVDDFGVETVIERGYRSKFTYDARLETKNLDTIFETLVALRAVPAVYIGDESKSVTIQFGRYRELQIVLSGPTISECALEVGSLL